MRGREEKKLYTANFFVAQATSSFLTRKFCGLDTGRTTWNEGVVRQR
ncbi:hypothetical protein BRCON_1591 [Candidatus Sumerlaea chitinivorans]|uniref:Uncharacterized protein n=1 Tax=Sumerlaea chitinivorans TaxID=2250252 RepID=A0A2Z4Y6A9_SUMC1|nr:hypothetical protein BRCON_1591 [Candidatus Sumerlaea chitinivorans]